MGVPTEARQQEMQVDEFGDFVLAQVIASSVGQRGDGLSCLPHLEGRGKG